MISHEYVEARIIVQGKVQGVGYRYVARSFAKDLGLAGTARNVEDGFVEILVQGPRAQIDHFIAKLKGSEAPGHVTAVDATFKPIEKALVDFIILL